MTETIYPMLAKPHSERAPMVAQALSSLLAEGGWIYDIKWDGVRCMAFCSHGTVTLINRRQVDITFRYPELVASLAETFENSSAVLDGEIVCVGDDGKPDFGRVHRRDAQQNVRAVGPLVLMYPATYVAFDLLRWESDDLRGLPLSARRALLETLAELWDGRTLLLSTMSTDGQAMWDMIQTEGLEGLIAKRLASRYVAGKQRDWVKLKPTNRISAVVAGFDPGEGARAKTFGALHLRLVGPDSTLVDIGKVGSGFNEADLALVLGRLTDSPTVPLVVEVEFQDVSPDKKLRFPVFKGIRDDQTIFDCTVDQIDVPKHEWSN